MGEEGSGVPCPQLVDEEREGKATPREDEMEGKLEAGRKVGRGRGSSALWKVLEG